MKQYVVIDEWSLTESGLHPEDNRIYESLMSIGNGRMGIRGNFEEDYSGDSLRGTYIAGIYYPDKTRVGWWKNGYPEYFAKVLNAPNFIGIKVIINGQNIDLANMKVISFKRQLNMRDGVLLREFVIKDDEGRETEVHVERFLSIMDVESADISYSVTPVNYDGNVEFIPYIDGNVINEDSNYDEQFWNEIDKCSDNEKIYLNMETKKTHFRISMSMLYDLRVENKTKLTDAKYICRDKFVGVHLNTLVSQGQTITLYKYIGVTSNRYYSDDKIVKASLDASIRAYKKGFRSLLFDHANKWHDNWENSDIVIKGDICAQQAIRFNIFQLNQTYTGDDPRLNIGPKGFTGEKYGGSTYWDTEAYCIPFYLSTADKSIAEQLLIYRHNHLKKAKKNAMKLGLKGAFYPMVTMNGEECHNEWEITFEEIHRNAAISYAIYNYVKYTGDEKYLLKYGCDVLVEVSRFWASRVNYNERKGKYMILGVTGPNEYENNVNNNWYTNTMAAWNIEYTLKVIQAIKQKYPEQYEKLISKLELNEEEILKWEDITSRMYYPYIEQFNVFEQQDGYMDKEQILVKDIPSESLPLNQHWSWDRILRSCFIKQADVLQGLYFLGEKFDLETKKRNFDFYEPRTVHESSLSPCIHCIIASEVGYQDKAYEFYFRTARLDLDNYNNDTCDGLHITSMAGTWMSIVQGFGGMKIIKDTLCFKPFIPKEWKEYSFRIQFRGRHLKITVNVEEIHIEQIDGEALELSVLDKNIFIKANENKIIKYNGK